MRIYKRLSEKLLNEVKERKLKIIYECVGEISYRDIELITQYGVFAFKLPITRTDTRHKYIISHSFI
jgi:hypothetical protein